MPISDLPLSTPLSADSLWTLGAAIGYVSTKRQIYWNLQDVKWSNWTVHTCEASRAGSLSSSWDWEQGSQCRIIVPWQHSHYAWLHEMELQQIRSFHSKQHPPENLESGKLGRKQLLGDFWASVLPFSAGTWKCRKTTGCEKWMELFKTDKFLLELWVKFKGWFLFYLWNIFHFYFKIKQSRSVLS